MHQFMSGKVPETILAFETDHSLALMTNHDQTRRPFMGLYVLGNFCYVLGSI